MALNNILSRSRRWDEVSCCKEPLRSANSTHRKPFRSGGELLKQSPCFPPPQGLHGHDCKSKSRSRRHFHQLFRQLRSPEQRSLMIVGTSITCSATTGSETKNLTTSAAWSTICDTGASRTGTPRTGSTICSTVRRRTRSCGPDTSSRRSGREPPAAGTSSTSIG